MAWYFGKAASSSGGAPSQGANGVALVRKTAMPAANGTAEVQRLHAQRIFEIREKEREEREKIEEQKKQDAARRLMVFREREQQARIANEEKRKAEEKLRAEDRIRAEEQKRREIEAIKNYQRTFDLCRNEKAWQKFEAWGCRPGGSLTEMGFKLKCSDAEWFEDDDEEKEEGEI